MVLSQDFEKTGCNRHHAISLLLANDPNLLSFIFSGTPRAIRPDVFTDWLDQGLEMDHQIARLIALALEIWWDRQTVPLHETYRYLGKIHFDSLLMAMEFLFAAGGCGCQTCRQRITDRPADWTPFSQSF